MNCPQCGAEVGPTDTFCGSCGNPVASATGEETPPVAPPPPASAGPAPDPAMTPPPPPPPPPPPAPPGQAPYTPPPMAPPVGGYVAQTFVDPMTGAPVAEWWQRVVALLIDGAIFFVPAWIIANVIIRSVVTTTYNTGFGSYSTVNLGLIYLVDFLFLAAYVAYYTYFNGGEKGQTLGKMALGIATRDESGQGSIGYGRAAGRYGIIFLLGLPCGIPLLIDYLSPLWDQRRQAWHDKTAHSLVVKVK